MINLRDLKGFHDHQYARHLVLKTDNVEVIVVCWKPGQGSPRHGHGASDVVEIVLEGEMSFINYFPDGKKVSGVCQAGDISHTPVGVEHEISNQSSDQDLVTLHVYSPPLIPALQGFDLGYANDVSIQEIQLPQNDVLRVMRAAAPGKHEEPNYMI